MHRRAVLLGIGLPALLGGCGWSPVYGDRGGATGSADVSLAAIDVPLLPERSGQLLRNALQARLYGPGGPAAPRFTLGVALVLNFEGVAITQANAATAQRITGSADFTLRSLATDHRTLLSGSARAADDLNTIGQEFFSQQLETETITRRLTELLADQITLQLAGYFREHPAAA